MSLPEGSIMQRVLKARTQPAQAGQKRKGRTCGTISKYRSGCHCPDCAEASRRARRATRKRTGK